MTTRVFQIRNKANEPASETAAGFEALCLELRDDLGRANGKIVELNAFGESIREFTAEDCIQALRNFRVTFKPKLRRYWPARRPARG